MEKTLHNQSGMVLVLAMLIIASVLAAAAGFNNLIIREIQQSRLIDQSIQAHYLAESGVERALYQVRQREAISDCDLLVTGHVCGDNGFCPAPNDNIPCVTTPDSSLSTRGGWQVAATSTLEFTVFLEKGESFQIDLFDPFEVSQSRINKLIIDAGTLTGVSMYGEFLNLTKILNITGASVCLNQPPVFKHFISFSGAPVSIDNLDGREISGDCSYSFKLNYPIDEDEDSLITITVYEISGNQLPIPGRLVIDTEAIFGQSLQKIKVNTPMRPPLSGLYDFVLFSEEKIMK